jgi:hypothetical protein
MKLNLLSAGTTNAKTKKNEAETYILYLAPARQNSTGKSVCPHATEGCTWACLFTAGLGAFSNVQQARIRKTDLFFENRNLFLNMLILDLNKINDKARRENKTIYVRLNGTSDLDFDKILKLSFRPSLQDFSNLKFYDYTKDKVRARVQASSMHPNWIDNYDVTYSRSEVSTDAELVSLLSEGVNVAVVFKKDLPEHYLGFPVLDGDLSDLRYNDPKGYVIGLKAKGKARKDTSGFVVA